MVGGSMPVSPVPFISRRLFQARYFGKRACRADQLVGFEENVCVGRLLPRKEADRHKRGATQQPHEHDLSVSTPVRIVKRAGHRPSQAAAHQARNRTHILTLPMKVTATRQFETKLARSRSARASSRCGGLLAATLLSLCAAGMH
jgi:hypothetical protein